MGGGGEKRFCTRSDVFAVHLQQTHFLNVSCNCTGCGVHPGPDNYSLFIVLLVHCSELQCSNIFVLIVLYCVTLCCISECELICQWLY